MLNKKKNAFTITELVIVIAVIAILAAVLIPTFSNVVASANQSAALQVCRNSLSDYIAQAASDNNPDNDNPVGMVFSYNGYYYVYLNSALQRIEPQQITEGSGATFPTVDGFNTTDLDLTAEGTTLVFAVADQEKVEGVIDNGVFVYNITLNEATYAGYFVYDSEKVVLEGATLAYGAGYAVYDAEDAENATPITVTKK